MGGQVLDHADVGDPVRERALAAGDDLEDLAQLAGLQPGAQALQRRVVALDVADPGDQARATRRPRPVVGPPRPSGPAASRSARRRRPRPAAGRPPRAARSGRRRRRSRCRAPISSLDASGRPGARSRAGARRRRVDDADQVDAVEPAEHAGVVAPHRAQADQAGAQRAARRSSRGSRRSVHGRRRSGRGRPRRQRRGAPAARATSAAARSVSGRSQRGPGLPSASRNG